MNQKDRGPRRIVLTGGHAATTALATVEELVRREKSTDVYFIGSKYAVEGLKAPTLESLALPKFGVSFFPIISGRIQRRLTLWTLPSLLKIPLGFIHALLLLTRIRPEIIVSFGGYAAFPVVFVGWALRIPVILHEQTSAVGRANLLSVAFAKWIAISRGQSSKFFPKKKVKIVGNPVLSDILKVSPKAEIGNPPVIYISGGSRGSQSVNRVVEGLVEKLLKEYILIHLTGYLDYSRYLKLRKSLKRPLREKYEVYEVIDPGKIANIYKRADIVVSRAGANTVSEIIATKRPAVVIPLPFSYKDEQTKNAQFAQKYGIARILNQENLTEDRLFKEIISLRKNWNKMVTKTKDKKVPDAYAARELVDLVESTLR